MSKQMREVEHPRDDGLEGKHGIRLSDFRLWVGVADAVVSGAKSLDEICEFIVKVGRNESRSTIALSVKRLEKHYGVDSESGGPGLIQRKPNVGIAGLTPEGLRLKNIANSIIRSVTSPDLRSRESEETITCGSQVFFELAIMDDVIADFYQRHLSEPNPPWVRIAVREITTTIGGTQAMTRGDMACVVDAVATTGRFPEFEEHELGFGFQHIALVPKRIPKFAELRRRAWQKVKLSELAKWPLAIAEVPDVRAGLSESDAKPPLVFSGTMEGTRRLARQHGFIGIMLNWWKTVGPAGDKLSEIRQAAERDFDILFLDESQDRQLATATHVVTLCRRDPAPSKALRLFLDCLHRRLEQIRDGGELILPETGGQRGGRTKTRKKS